jgi:hypothetical protein
MDVIALAEGVDLAASWRSDEESDELTRRPSS